jgi:hypothetical protein
LKNWVLPVRTCNAKFALAPESNSDVCVVFRRVKLNPTRTRRPTDSSSVMEKYIEGPSSAQSHGRNFLRRLTSDTHTRKKLGVGANSREKKKSVLLKSEPPPAARSIARSQIYI